MYDFIRVGAAFMEKDNKLKLNTYISKLMVAMLIIIPALVLLFGALKSSERTSAATTGTVTAASLFVRKGPSTSYEKLELNGKTVYLSKGDYVAIQYETNGWYYVTASFNGTKVTGYVSAAYIATSGNIPTAAPSATPTSKVSATKTPTPTPTKAATKKLTDEVVTEGFPLKGYVTAGRLNVRKDAGTNNDRIDGIDKDQLVTVNAAKKASTGEYWYKITYTTGGTTKEGWVSQAYISVDLNSKVDPTKTPTPKATSTPKPAGPTPTPKVVTSVVTEGFPLQGFCNTSGLNVRSGAGTSYDKVTVLTLNQYVTITGYKKATDTGKVWYEVTVTKSGKTYKGYASSSYISVEIPGVVQEPTKAPEATATPVPTEAPKNTPTPAVSFVGDQVSKDEISGIGDYCYTAIVNTYQLNMREKPETSALTVGTYSQDTKVLILDREITGTTPWYKVAVKKDGTVSYGYMSAKYTKLVFAETVYAKVTEDKTKLRSTASATSAYVKLADGNIATLSLGEVIYITDEINQNGQKWFGVKSASGNTGYVLSTEVDLSDEKGMVVPTATPKPTATPTPKASDSNPTPTPVAAVPTPAPGEPVYDKETGMRMYHYYVYEVRNGVQTLVLDGVDYYFPAVSMVAPVGYIYDHHEVYPDTVETGYTSFIKAHTLTQDETYIYYYVRDPNASLVDAWDPYMTNEQFESYMDSQGFPETYKDSLRELHRMHPNWILTAYQTGISWDDAISSENVVGRNLIPNSYSVAWKSLETGAYNWDTNQFIIYDGSTWVTASADALAYFIDPRNWLDEQSVFMFENLEYKPDYQDVEGVEALLVNTPFYHTSYTYVDSNGITRTTTYAETFITAAEYSGVSPYHLASRVRQEIVTSSTTVSNSATGTVEGYEGLYNFYNIGAYHSTVSGGAIKNGLKYARNGASNNDALNTGSLIPWTDPFRAIVGGAYIIGQNYINRGQNTIYLQKFNMTADNTFMHQYMANVVAPSSESKKMATAYTDLEKPITFSIPVFDNMPDIPSPKPSGDMNPNNLLSNIQVLDCYGNEVALAPYFSPATDQEYYVSVANYSDYVQINATPVSGSATVIGNGVVSLWVGMNTYEILVISESGEYKSYVINIVRQEY